MEILNSWHIAWALFVSERPGVELLFFVRRKNLAQKGGG